MKDILIDVLYTDEPLLGRDALDLVELLNDEQTVHISHVAIKRDWDEQDGKPVGVRISNKGKIDKEESPAIVYTREPFDNAAVLKSLQELWER